MVLEHITKAYGRKLVLDDASLEWSDGEVVGILGVNGSGKSTLLGVIAERFRKGDVSCGYVPQECPLFEELKVVDNLRMWCPLRKGEILARLSEDDLRPLGVERFLDTPVGKMSGGMKKRLSLASVLINRPQLLLMDEPLAALDLPAKEDILSFIRSYANRGNTVLIASHEEELFRFCNRVFLLHGGTLTDAALLKAEGKSYAALLRSSL